MRCTGGTLARRLPMKAHLRLIDCDQDDLVELPDA